MSSPTSLLLPFYPNYLPLSVSFNFLLFNFSAQGFYFKSLSDAVVEIKETYDSYEFYQDENVLEEKPCAIGNAVNNGTECIIEIKVPKDMKPPILIHYEIDNFYQNHRYYVKSRNDNQVRLMCYFFGLVCVLKKSN